jgi:hypothetical protein
VRQRRLCGNSPLACSSFKLRKAEKEQPRSKSCPLSGRQRQGIVPGLQIGTDLYELTGMRSDSSHYNYNGAQVTGVEKREIKIPMEIQKQEVDLDEKMCRVSRVAAPAVGPWQRQLNELGGVKPLAFGQHGELGPGFEQLLDQLAEESADEAARRYLTHPQPRSSEGSPAPAAEAAGGDGSPKGTGGCAPTPPSLRTTGVGHRGGEARRARRIPQRSPGKGVG